MLPDVESIKLCLSSGTDKNIVTVIPTDNQNEQGISLKPWCQAISQATVSVFVRDEYLEALKRSDAQHRWREQLIPTTGT